MIRTARGQATMLALGCVAVVVAIGIELAQRVKAARNHQKDVASREEAEELTEAFRSRLQHPDDCTDALAGNKISPGARTDVAMRFLLDLEAEEGARELTAGSTVSANGMQLTSLKLEVGEEDFRTEILDANGLAVELRRYTAFLQPAFATQAGRWVPLSRTSRKRDLGIPLLVWTLPPPPIGSGEIQSCFGRESAGTLCNDLGGYFIPHTRPYDQSCRQSLKTLRRVVNPTGGTVLAPVANCRIGFVATHPSECPKWNVAFGAAQINGATKVHAGPGNHYLCQVCQ